MRSLVEEYRPPFYGVFQINQLRQVKPSIDINEPQVEQSTVSDEEQGMAVADKFNQDNAKVNRLNVAYKHFPAANPKFFIGSFSMNITGLLLQLAIVLFLSKNSESDSDVSGIITTLPQSKSDIFKCLIPLIIKDLFLNMIEKGLTKRYELKPTRVDALSVLSYAAMRLANFLRFPNYLHNESTISTLANLSLHSASFSASLCFIWQNIVSMGPNSDSSELTTHERWYGKVSNGVFTLGALFVLTINGSNLINMADAKIKLSIQEATVLGTSRMVCFLIANGLGRNVYHLIENSDI